MGASLKGLSRTILGHYRKPRVLGLDLLRITASLSIILHHGNLSRLVGQNGFSALFADDGYLAVDIFFVLSGWLLTRQVLRMRTTITRSMALAVRFWTRRWARTLPPYWIVLVLMFIFGHQMMPEFIPGFSLRLLVTHALFLQTILPPNVFGVSWSLVTEEWFYLLLPFVMLLAIRVRSWRVLLGFGLAALLLPTVIRSLMLLAGTSFLDVRVQPEARFEGLVVGALLAAASVGAPWWRTQVLPRRQLLFGMGALLVVVDLVAGAADSGWYRVIGLLGFSLGLGLLMPLLSQLRWPGTAPMLAVVGVAYLSELTYPLYLLHAFRIHVGPAQGATALATGLLSIVTLFIAASVLHLCVERPFLAWRDRIDGTGRRYAEPALAPLPPSAAVPRRTEVEGRPAPEVA